MKSKLTIAMIIICLALEPANAYVYFDDGLVHDIDWVIDDTVWIDLGGPAPPERGISVLSDMSTTLNLLPGGEITGSIHAYGNSVVNIEGGIVGNDLRACWNSEIIMTSGMVYDAVVTFHSGSITISGGWIGGAILAGSRTAGQTTITLIGTDFAVGDIYRLETPVPVNYGSLWNQGEINYDNSVVGILTGTLHNGGSIDNYFRIRPDSDIILVEVIPEPATLLLLGLGGILLFRKGS